MLTEKTDYYEEICKAFPLDHSKAKTTEVKADEENVNSLFEYTSNPAIKKAFNIVQAAVFVRILEVVLMIAAGLASFILLGAGSAWGFLTAFVGFLLTIVVEEIHRDMMDSAVNHINR